MKLNRFIIKLAGFTAVLVLALLFKGNWTAEAANTNLSLGSKISGSITNTNTNNVYTINLKKDGRVTVNINGEKLKNFWVELYDKEDKYWYSSSLYTGGKIDTRKWSKYIDLQKGTYYIKISKYSEYTGTYKIKASFQAANNNEKEPNNSLLFAQTIKLNTQTINGFIAYNDFHDIYRINVPVKGKIKINLKAYSKATRVQLFDSTGDLTWEESISNNTKKAKTWSRTDTLNAGTYYVVVSQKKINTGKYTLNVNFSPTVASPTVNKVTTNSTGITGKSKANYTIAAYVGSKKIGSAKTDTKGLYKVKISKQKANTKIKVIAIDGKGNKSMGTYVTVTR